MELVCATGSRPPSGRRSSEVPGWQSTKYSPISDCGRISQCASLRRSASPGSVTSAFTSASGRPSTSLTLNSLVWPARTPATLKSPPSVSPNALSNSSS